MNPESAGRRTRDERATAPSSRCPAPVALETARRRRLSSISFALAAAVIALGLIHALPAKAGETGWQTPTSVRAAAESYARSFAGRPDAAVDAVGVDDRLRLPLCGNALTTEAAGAFNAGRGTVVVECAGPKAWRLFVPVRLSHTVPVLVARRALHRNDVLAAEDLAIVERPAASLPYEYLTSIEDAVGTTLRRSLPEGTVVVPAAVDKPSVVERGARVTVIAGAGAVQVRAEGVALHRAGLGERVRVETASGRIVEGRAEAPDVVRVGS